jgi:hypothetical protein
MASKSPAHTISDFLASQGLGTLNPAGPWRISTGRQPDSPDTSITVYDTGGQPDHPVLRLNYPSIQIRVRGNKDAYPTAFSKINDVKELLLGLPSQDINGDRWTAVNMIGGVMGAGYDAVSRPEFTVSFRCIVEPAADSSTQMHRVSL